MRYLFECEGLEELATLSACKTLYVFDFDGTLSPIVSDRRKAVISPPMEALLRALAETVPVAIVSGRSLCDISSRVGIGSVRLVGNHGSEGLPSGKVDKQASEVCRVWIRDLSRSHRVAGIEFDVEDKGASLSLHYRNAGNKVFARGALLTLISGLTPAPRVVPGKCVLNLIPSESPNKGDAVRELISHFDCERALFVGDDATDEDVFGMNDTRVLGVRVQQLRGSRATYYLKSQIEVAKLIKLIMSK